MRTLLAVLAAVIVAEAQGGLAQASTAETQARLAAARPVPTQAVTPPPPPVEPASPAARGAPLAAPPKPNLPSTEAPAPRPTPRRDFGLILLLPALLVLVALVRWFARRRRSATRRV
jgi:hypothetical protein